MYYEHSQDQYCEPTGLECFLKNPHLNSIIYIMLIIFIALFTLIHKSKNNWETNQLEKK